MNREKSETKEGEEYRFQYAAKFLCTANIPGTSQTTTSVLPGVYQTAVNIHNPDDQTVRWRRKITQPGLGFSKFIEDKLKPDEAARWIVTNTPGTSGRSSTNRGFSGHETLKS
jgi:hypothetical protein